MSTLVWQPLGMVFRSYTGPWVGLWKDCTFLPVEGEVSFIGGPYPGYGIDPWIQKNSNDRQFLKPARYQLRPWRDGRNLDVYHSYQSPTYEKLPAITAPDFYGDFPPGVYKHADLIELGKPIFGAAIPANAEPFGPLFFAAPAVT